MQTETNEKRKIEIYSPATKSVKDYGLGETVEVTINGQALIPILADKIYKSPYSAIRELYVNEVTATKKALRINSNLKPEIHISINTHTRELKIKGVNSLGIDSDTFKYILAVMGNSGNNKGDETGYYGIGFFSFVKLSERIIINSYSLESNEKWAYIAKSALKFERLPENSFKPLDKTGFEITLVIKNELSLSQIEQTIKNISLLSGVKTLLYVDGVLMPLEQYADLQDYFKITYRDYFENNATYSIMYDVIENEDFELIIGHGAGNGCKYAQKAFLINVPIDFEFDNMPKICLLNVKNERVFKPSADRERFAENDENALREKISKFLFIANDRLPKIKTINDYYDSKYRWFYSYIGNVSLDTYVKDGKEKDYYKRIKAFPIKSILPIQKPKEFRISLSLRKKAFENYKNQNIFACQIRDSSNYQYLINIGFVDIDEGKKKVTREYDPNKLTKNFKFHNHWESFEVLPKNALAVVKVDDVRNNVLKDYCKHSNIYYITQKADYHETTELEDLDDLVNDTDIYLTNKGFMTAKQILDECTRFNVYKNTNDDDDKDRRYIPHLIKQEAYLIIRFTDNDESELLESLIRIKKQTSYINTWNVDFEKIERDIKDQKYREIRDSIKDERLKYFVNQFQYEFKTDEKAINFIADLDRELNK